MIVKWLIRKPLWNKFDVITQKQANNILLAELPIIKQSQGNVSKTDTKNAIPKGLNNMGNTWFLNSTLQWLLNTTPLKNYLTSEIHSAKWKVKGNCPFWALEKLMIEVNTTTASKVTPKDIVNNLKKTWNQYKFGRQEDAHEFFVMFLQGILRASFGNSATLLKKYEHLTMLYRIFAGKLRSQVMCLSWSYCSNSYEPFLALSLDVSTASTFEEWIKRFWAPEILDGDNKYQCGGWDKLSKAKKRMTIFKPPRILTVQFMRFTALGKKINKFVQFPKSFNLRVFVSENVDTKIPREQQTDHIYNLYGIIVHAGQTWKSGHYYSFVRNEEKWFMWNDEKITEIKDIDRVLKQNAYILFYKYRIPNVNKTASKSFSKESIMPSLTLNRTKSLSVEIKESHDNKNKNFMPLSGYFEGDKEENSEEEEEKLTK